MNLPKPIALEEILMNPKKMLPNLAVLVLIGMGIAYFICKQFARSFSKFSY